MITMTQGEVILAFKSIRKIASLDTSINTAKKIFKVKSLLQPIIDFQMQEEQKIFEAYPNLDKQTFQLDKGDMSDEEFAAQIKEVNSRFDELQKTEQEINTDKIIITDTKGMTLSSDDIANLSKIIDFEEEESEPVISLM